MKKNITERMVEKYGGMGGTGGYYWDLSLLTVEELRELRRLAEKCMRKGKPKPEVPPSKQ